MSIEAGHAESLGAMPADDGTNFAVYSSVAERVELCLFDAQGRQTSLDMPDCDAGIWHGFVPHVGAGQRYGYRVHGDWDPAVGKRCNPAKLLLDPYARSIKGDVDWNGFVFDYAAGTAESMQRCDHDSAPSVPLGIVTPHESVEIERPAVPWSESIVYECNLRGFTMRHPAVADSERGRFSGMRNFEVLQYIKALGITTIELMPILAYVDEHHLARQGLRNYWGYNTISFFAPMPRLGSLAELREMVNAIHETGLEVVLDVAYNHTAEGDSLGPTLSFRGFDNQAYYRTAADDPSVYINDTGCGNTMDADSPVVQKLILDSLRYLHQSIGCDGFRFDLATILGRHGDGFSGHHPLLTAISDDPDMQSAKLIAEPWDPGPGGYQLGAFPMRWGEWNDQFRDTVRRFWRGDGGISGRFAQRIHGSSDIFEAGGRTPQCSINFVAAHDGFTVQDTVSYEHRHNLANGEDNRDGHAHNYSRNYGTEGASDDDAINAMRRQQRLNLLGTLLLSQGTPMLLAGDEFGQTQQGNNNAYAQDNETTWLDWSRLDDDPEFVTMVRTLLQLRRDLPQLRLPYYVHEQADNAAARFGWFNAAGAPKHADEWADSRAFTALVSDGLRDAAIVINATDSETCFCIPQSAGIWQLAFATADSADFASESGELLLPGYALALLQSTNTADHGEQALSTTD